MMSYCHDVSYVTCCVPGKRASEGERREAMRNAQGFIKAKGLKPGTAITRSGQGCYQSSILFYLLLPQSDRWWGACRVQDSLQEVEGPWGDNIPQVRLLLTMNLTLILTRGWGRHLAALGSAHYNVYFAPRNFPYFLNWILKTALLNIFWICSQATSDQTKTQKFLHNLYR